MMRMSMEASKAAAGVPETAASRIRVFEDLETLEPKPDGWTRFVCFSDTHGREERIPANHIVPGDVLLHAGDFTNAGEVSQVKNFAKWLEAYPAAHKVVIAGNHDVTFQPDYYERAWNRYHSKKMSSEEARASLIKSGSCTYLEEESTEVLGYKIYGSPWQPEFCDWAFNYEKEKGQEMWKQIPQDSDIVITHGPPLGIGDLCLSGIRAGCPDLKKALQDRRTPVHLFGHIHEGYGTDLKGDTLFVNACTCTFKYRPLNPPVVFDMPPAAEIRSSREVTTTASSTGPEPASASPEAVEG